MAMPHDLSSFTKSAACPRPASAPEVEDFVDFLVERESDSVPQLATPPAAASEPAFARFGTIPKTTSTTGV